ncbi:PhoX family protein, partial [Thalassobaculum salexigens]|uniref:PhoX family protein n=1 Tax=Thalassobaculum salexigens TaxID=455360 RepID=UPI00248E06EE
MDRTQDTVRATSTEKLSFDDWDELRSPRPAVTDFDTVVDRAMSRRGFLGGIAMLGGAAFLMGTSALTPARAASRLAFDAVAANSLDTITVPNGYRWQVLTTWGDPLWSDAADFDPQTRGTGASQERAFGDNNDGMALFTDGARSILAVNNEYTNLVHTFGNRPDGKPVDADDVRKGKAAHGVSVMEVAEADGGWSVVKDSPFNRRITADTPMEITGPARGHDLLKTEADPTGTTSLGTWNNCGNGRTPWGTYLTCEENFNGYFSSSDADYKPSEALSRYGVSNKDWGYAWAMADERFDISKNPNEPNRAGYIVEIDPFDPASTPKKRTALGRFKHENAEVVVAANGHVVVYLGDDERGEFLYRFVSAGTYSLGGDNSDLLENGKLYVAKFADDMRGTWVELTPESTGMASDAEIRIYTRQAASAVGATTMDRPEWVAANPHRVEAYCCLTNNKNRGIKPNAGGDETPVGGPNPRKANLYGQMVRWVPDNGDHTADGFGWDLFVTAGNPTVHDDANAGSANVTPENIFNPPDGLGFDSKGLMWIQTDGNYSNAGDFAGQGNNQMLVADPVSGEIRRFLVGPKECEITGITFSPDRRPV